MLVRSALARATWWSVPGLTCLLVSAVLAVASDGQVRLDAKEMADSRGANQSNGLLQSSCNDLQGNHNCVGRFGQACTDCSRGSYTIGNGNGGGNGYNNGIGGTGDCGTLFSGVCRVPADCSHDIQLGSCTKPSGSPSLQR